jgi:hypothetical protein
MTFIINYSAGDEDVHFNEESGLTNPLMMSCSH